MTTTGDPRSEFDPGDGSASDDGTDRRVDGRFGAAGPVDRTSPLSAPAAAHDSYDPYDASHYAENCDCEGHLPDAADPGMGDGLDRLDDLAASAGLEVPVDTAAEARPGRRSVTRRRFIQGLAAAGAFGYVVVREAKPLNQSSVESQVASRSASTGSASSTASTVPAADQLQMAAPSPDAIEELAAIERDLLLPAPVDQRVLVLIDFAGGNDGPSMVVPYGSGTYYDARPNLAIPAEDVLPIDSDVGLAPALGRLHLRQFATVEGVGPIDGSLSHFEMQDRWAQGDMLGQGGQRAGFLARLADNVTLGGAVTGLSVAGHTPRLEASESSTLALSNLNQLRVLTDDEWIYPRYRAAVRSFGGGPMSTTISESWNALFAVGDSMSSDIDRVDGDTLMVREGGGLGRQLAMAAEMIKADVGVRVIHAQHGGFDTHENHVGRHNRLMQQFDAAVDGFLQEIDAAGMSDRVLVATSSEFGRRLSQNGSGLDHGAASAMMLVGPVRAGRIGDPSPLNDLDGNGNLRTTLAFDRYLAALAQEWLGVEAGLVLPNAPQPIGLF